MSVLNKSRRQSNSFWRACCTTTAALAMTVVLSACQTAPKKDLAMERVKTKLEQLKNDEQLSGYAPGAVTDAERALRKAELAKGDLERGHQIYMAEKQIQIARAMAQREQLEESFQAMSDERNRLLLRASQLEAEQAREEAAQARMMMAASEEDAQRRREEALAAQEQGEESERQAQLALEEAEQARRLANSRASEADLARREAELVSAQMDTLKRQLENLQLRQTESGVVVTLGDVLFQTGEIELRDEARTSLVEVVDLLQTEPDKQIRIEGHTDSVGDSETNLRISQERADAVRLALVDLGVSADRMKSVGMGEDYPIGENESDEGRAKNRRVDVILLD